MGHVKKVPIRERDYLSTFVRSVSVSLVQRPFTALGLPCPRSNYALEGLFTYFLRRHSPTCLRVVCKNLDSINKLIGGHCSSKKCVARSQFWIFEGKKCQRSRLPHDLASRLLFAYLYYYGYIRITSMVVSTLKL